MLKKKGVFSPFLWNKVMSKLHERQYCGGCSNICWYGKGMGKSRINEKQFDGKYPGKKERNSRKGENKYIEIKMRVSPLPDLVT